MGRMGFTRAALAALAISMAGCGGAEASTEASAEATTAVTQEAVGLDALLAIEGPGLRAFSAQLQEMCEGARPGFQDGAISGGDLNGDRRTDYLVRMSHLTCGGEPMGGMWCGTAGCSHIVLVSQPADYVSQGFYADEVEMAEHDGRMVLRMPVEGGAPRVMAWNGSAMAETR